VHGISGTLLLDHQLSTITTHLPSTPPMSIDYRIQQNRGGVLPYCKVTWTNEDERWHRGGGFSAAVYHHTLKPLTSLLVAVPSYSGHFDCRCVANTFSSCTAVCLGMSGVLRWMFPNCPRGGVDSWISNAFALPIPLGCIMHIHLMIGCLVLLGTAVKRQV
jgi:hypothetical protein